jgi:hypothetical protein
MSFSCARLRVTKSAQRGSTFADHRISGLHEGRMPKFDTPTREAASCERRQYLGSSRWLHAECADQKGGPTRIAISGIGSLEKGAEGL